MSDLSLLSFTLWKALSNCFWPGFCVYGARMLVRMRRVPARNRPENVVSFEKVKVRRAA